MIGIAAAVILGLTFRVWNLPHHGFSHYDEAHYMMEVKFWKDVIAKSKDLSEALRSGRLNAAYIEENIDGLPPSFTPKPLHGLSIALFSIATGLNAEWSGCLWSALVGTLTIVLVAWWACRHFGAVTGILAACLLAVSRSHVMYSRSQLAEADAIFFALVAVFCHANLALQFRKDVSEPSGPAAEHLTSMSSSALGHPCPAGPRAWAALGIGVLYGIAVGVNYRCLLIMPLIFAWDIWACRGAARRLVFLSLGVLAPLSLIELPYRIYIWRGGSLPPGITTYFEGFWNRMFQDLPAAGSTAVGSFFRPHGDMFGFYVHLDGIWWLLGMALGLWATLRTRCPVRRLVAILAWAPIALFSLVTRGDGPRAVMTSIPFFVILSAVGWIEYENWFRTRNLDMARKLVAVLVACVLIGMGAGSWNETQVASAWPEVGRRLSLESPPMVYTTNPLAVRYYLRKNRAKLIPKEDTALAQPGVWVIDRYHATYAYPYPVIRTLKDVSGPPVVVEGRVYPRTGLFLDWGAFTRDRNWRDELKREGLADIEIYRVEGEKQGK